MARIQRFVRDAERAGDASDDEPVVLVVRGLSDEGGAGGHGSVGGGFVGEGGFVTGGKEGRVDKTC